MIDYDSMKNFLFRLLLIATATNFALCAHAQPLSSQTSNTLRNKALGFIKNHNIYDKAWKWEGFSYQNYTNLPNKEELNYQWFKNNESLVTEDENGNAVITWVGLPGCRKNGNIYKDESSGTECYSLLKFSVYFDDTSTPMYIRVGDIGGIE